MEEDTIETKGGTVDVEEIRILLHLDHKTPFYATRHGMSNVNLVDYGQLTSATLVKNNEFLVHMKTFEVMSINLINT
jgi:hypothetical protein